MKAPICAFDAKSGILCPRCEEKVSRGHISDADVRASMQLYRLAEEVEELDRLTLVKALEVEGDWVLLVPASDVTRLRKNGFVIKRMEEALGGRVWLLDAEASDRKMIDDLFHPTKVVSVNTVWLPDGSKLTKVIIAGRKTERFPVPIERAKAIAKALRGIDLLVEFEYS